jgi:hypothetical protein
MSGFKVVDLSVVISIFMRGKTMISKRLAGIGVLIFALVMGCAGNYGNFKRQTRSESKATKQQLIHNWSDYDIWAYKPPRITIIIFDPKNDNRKISVGSNWRMVKDQQMWTEIVKENTASDGEFTLVWGNYGPYYSTGVQEIWGPDNQLYGYVVYQQYAVSLQRVEQIDENTIRISWSPPRAVGGR